MASGVSDLAVKYDLVALFEQSGDKRLDARV